MGLARDDSSRQADPANHGFLLFGLKKLQRGLRQDAVPPWRDPRPRRAGGTALTNDVALIRCAAKRGADSVPMHRDPYLSVSNCTTTLSNYLERILSRSALNWLYTSRKAFAAISR